MWCRSFVLFNEMEQRRHRSVFLSFSLCCVVMLAPHCALAWRRVRASPEGCVTFNPCPTTELWQVQSHWKWFEGTCAAPDNCSLQHVSQRMTPDGVCDSQSVPVSCSPYLVFHCRHNQCVNDVSKVLVSLFRNFRREWELESGRNNRQLVDQSATPFMFHQRPLQCKALF